MGTTVTSIEGQNGADDTVKVVKDGTETIFETIEDAAQFCGIEVDRLETALDNAGYDEEVDLDNLPEEEEDENEEESGEGDDNTAA